MVRTIPGTARLDSGELEYLGREILRPALGEAIAFRNPIDDGRSAATAMVRDLAIRVRGTTGGSARPGELDSKLAKLAYDPALRVHRPVAPTSGRVEPPRPQTRRPQYLGDVTPRVLHL
jgi:hypothetical protein